MDNRQKLLITLLSEKLNTAKVGLIVNGIDGINPSEIVKEMSKTYNGKIYAAIIGYETTSVEDCSDYTIKNEIEEAVAWRNKTECVGSIVLFINGDIDKRHSLDVLDTISRKDMTYYAIQLQLRKVKDENQPIQEFWNALLETSEYYTLQNVEEFITAVENESDKTKAISNNLWRLELLCDDKILSSKVDRKQRLIDNKNKTIDIAQISENGRKNLSKSLAKASATEKAVLKKTYHYVEDFSQYGEKDILKHLDYSLVISLLSAAKPKKSKSDSTGTSTTIPSGGGSTPVSIPEVESKPLKKTDIDEIVAEQLLFGDDETQEDIKELYEALKEEYADESKTKITLNLSGDSFGGSSVELEKPQDKLRELVGQLSNENAWGGIIYSKETEVKDAIESSGSPEIFTPNSLLYPSDHRPFIDFLVEFDEAFKFEKSFKETFDKMTVARSSLCEHLDFLMYNPFVLFQSNEEARNALSTYIETWSELYSLFNEHENEMTKSGSSGPTTFVGRAMLAFDVLYLHTGDNKWKAVLLPLHPMYLWSYYEICKTIFNDKEKLGKSEIADLKSVLKTPPQMLNYLAVDKGITKEKDIILPCSGNIQMLPTFENSTNRFLGDDGLDAIPDILERWIDFAPFSKNEIRICTVDAPNLSYVLKSLTAFIEKNNVQKVVYDVYYTRGQNGNTELANLDYSDKDYNIGEYIKNGSLSICIHTGKNIEEIQNNLSSKPVHIAYYFDQSKYEVKDRPDEGRLYSNPFVVTYEFSYDSILHTGSISPSSRSQTGIVGDYHKLMVSTAYIQQDKSPWLCINSTDGMESMLLGIKNNQAQWIVIADRNIGNYEIKEEYGLIPLGEQVYDRRRVAIWASKDSRKINEYKTDLMHYNLSPNRLSLVNMIKDFGHIAATGLIGIPKASFDSRATKYRQKGWFGTLFASTWYAKRSGDEENVMVASLDSDKARIWLTARDEESADVEKKYGQERADLVGLKYDKDSDTLYIQAIEVKTRDEENESQRDYKCYVDEYGKLRICGHAADQIAAMINILQSIFSVGSSASDAFVSARREVLKYQIITECFRNIHAKEWQEEWHKVLSRAFDKNDRDGLSIVVSGILVYIRLGDASTKESEPQYCVYDGAGEFNVELSVLTSHDIQTCIFDDSSSTDDSSIKSDTESVNNNSEIEHNALIECNGSNNTSDDAPFVPEIANPILSEATKTIDIADVDESIDTINSGLDQVSATPLENVRMLIGEDVRSKEKFYWEFGNKKLNNRHLLINGNSGCGKTYCIEALLMEASLQGVSSVIFDYTGGFTNKKLDPIFKEKVGDRLQQRVVRATKIPINPFMRHELEIDDDVFVPEEDVDIASKLASTIASVYDMGDQQKSSVYTSVLNGLRKYGDSMNFRHLAEELEELGTSYAKTALSRIQQFIDINPFITGESFDWSDIRDANGKIYIFQFAGYGRDVQVMLTELLLWDLWSFSVKNGSEDKPFIYVIDEAQNLSHSEKSPSGMILTEGRKYGLSGWYATQFMKPQLSDDEIQRLQQADQKLYFCPPGDGVMTVAKNIDISAQGSKEWAEKLQKLNKGECVTCGSMVRSGIWNKYPPRIVKVTSLSER